MASTGEAWATAKVENLAEYITVGFVGSMSSLFVEEGVPVLRGQNINPYKLDLANLKYISQDTHRKWKKSALRQGDVVIVRVGYPGTACVIPAGLGDVNAASLVIVRPNPDLLDSKFLAYVINSPWGKAQVAGKLVGAAQQVFNTKTAAELEISAPPLFVQKRIAGILSAYDELIENSQRRIRILESMARALYREWFVHFRFPGHEHHPRVASPLGEIPQGWEVGRLDDVLVLQRGFDLPKAARKDGLIPIIAATGVTGFHNEAKANAPGVVTGRSGTIGEVLYVQENFWPLNTSLWVKDFPRSEPLYAYFVLSSIDLKLFNSGAAVPTLNRNDIHGLATVVPPLELQKGFQDIAGAMLAQTLTLERKVANLRRTRDLLLPRLLSGQIDVDAA